MGKITESALELVGKNTVIKSVKICKKRWSRAGRCFSKAGISESGRFRKGPYRTGQ